MGTRVIVGIAALLCVSVLGMSSTFANWEMMDKVNEKLPQQEQFGALWWYASKYQRLHREYRRLYPVGRLLVKFHVLVALAVACLLVCAWSFGFF